MRPSEKFQIFIMLGKSGSGKGTQVELLQKKFGFEVISSGTLLRERAKKDDFVGRRIHELISKGILTPSPVIFHLWMHKFEELREQGVKKIIFEGSPRKVYEARLLEEVFPFYQWEGGILAIHIDISDEQAMKRLFERARSDDDKEAIQKRLQWYQEEVVPVVEYYREKGVLVEINGEQSIEEVHQEILEKLHLR
jgi:adenylate kinase